MNYLGHAFLSFGDMEILTGNMIADHVKGQIALKKFPLRVARGIRLHRKIDFFTDQHPAIRRAAVFFQRNYGLYSGAITDNILDHFLANDPLCFPSKNALLSFSKDVYASLRKFASEFPPAFAQYFPYMEQEDWLAEVWHAGKMRQTLKRLERRAQHLQDTEKAFQIFIDRYHQLAQCYYELMEGLIPFVKLELSQPMDL